jgi:hypothetical protein
MTLSIINPNKEPNSYIKVVVDVFSIFMLGAFLLILMLTYKSNLKLFILSISIYLIILQVYVLYYMYMIKDVNILKSTSHRLLNFINIYGIFISIFIISITFLIPIDNIYS